MDSTEIPVYGRREGCNGRFLAKGGNGHKRMPEEAGVKKSSKTATKGVRWEYTGLIREGTIKGL